MFKTCVLCAWLLLFELGLDNDGILHYCIYSHPWLCVRKNQQTIMWNWYENEKTIRNGKMKRKGKWKDLLRAN